MNERMTLLFEALGLSQTEIARRLQVTSSYICKLINQPTAAPSDRFISSMCREFNVNETWLRTGEGEMFKPVDRESELAMFMGEVMADEDDSFRKRFLAALVKLDVEDWKVIEKLATEMTKGLGDNA